MRLRAGRAEVGGVLCTRRRPSEAAAGRPPYFLTNSVFTRSPFSTLYNTSVSSSSAGVPGVEDRGICGAAGAQARGLRASRHQQVLHSVEIQRVYGAGLAMKLSRRHGLLARKGAHAVS